MKIKKGQPKTKNKKKSETINLDNEIIIGLNTKPAPKSASKAKNKKVKKKNNKKTTRNAKFAKILIVLIILIAAIILVLLSDLFNCKEIEVIGNNKISAEEIINVSGIKTEENMFKINVRKVKENIKNNAYINTVKIKRKIDGKIQIIIEERVATYMLSCETGCIYINNQGYILETSEQPISAPIIMGFNTDLSTKTPGDRLDNEDLPTLEKIILITNIAETKGLKDIITYINVSNLKDILIYMDVEKKTVHFGDEQEASKKFERLKVVMEQEKRERRRNIYSRYRKYIL